jgi:hypothetical protein
MVRDKYPIPSAITIYSLSHLDDLSCDLVAEHPRGFFDTIPFHDITATDATGQHFHQQFTRTHTWSWNLLQPHILVVIIHGYAHNLSGQKSYEFGVQGSE